MFPYIINKQIGSIHIIIGTYSLFALAAICFTGFLYIMNVQDGRKKIAAHVIFLGIILFFSLAGARIVQFLIDLKVKQNSGLSAWQILKNTGGTVTGGIVFGIIGTFIYAKIDPHRIMNWQSVDTIAMAFPAGHMIGRLGCLSAGCCYGKICFECGFTVTYPADWPVDFFTPEHISHGPRIASPLIAAVGLLVISSILFTVLRTTKTRGQVTALYFLLYGPFRFLQEFTRGDPERGYFGPLSTGQWFGIAATLLGIVLLLLYIRRWKAGKAAEPFLPFNGKEPRSKDAFEE